MNKRKKLIISGVAVFLVSVLLAASLWKNGAEEVRAARMYGVQQVVNNISAGSPFIIVEVVPDESYASFGYYVEGQEPQLAASLLQDVVKEGFAARKAKVSELLKNIVAVDFVEEDFYKEQLFRPFNIESWTKVELKTSVIEERTGRYVESAEYGLEYGDYVYSVIDGVETYTYEKDGRGRYVWVDDSENGTPQEVEFGRIYIQTNVTSKNWFLKDVLELDSSENIQVISLTPQQLETEMQRGNLAWNLVDFLYLSATGILSEEEAAYTENNDFSWETTYQIYQYTVNAKLPIMVDNVIVEQNDDTNIKSLANLLKAYTEDTTLSTYDLSEGNREASIAQAAQDAAAKTGKEWIAGNIYVGTDLMVSDLKSTKQLNESVTNGIFRVISELESEEFYNEVSGLEPSVEVTENKLTQATLMKYIINYGNRRVDFQKETLKVLDIEPTKYSTLSEETVRSWLTDSSYIKTIQIDQTSTSEFIGKMVDLVEEYDLIYIGSCIGNGEANGSLNTDYNDDSLDGLIYTDLGDIAIVPSEFGGLSVSEYDESGNVITRFSGNDITEMKKQDLIEFVNSGYPIVVSSELFKKNEEFIDSSKVRGNEKDLENSSNLYQFLASFTGDNVVSNVINEATVKNSKLSRYVNLPKLEMTMIAAPEEYVEGDSSSSIVDRELNFTFEFSDPARVLSDTLAYKVQLFVDADADGQFSALEEMFELQIYDDAGRIIPADEIKPGERYSVTKELPSDYEGIVTWKLRISTSNALGNTEVVSTVRDSSTGQAFVKPENLIGIKALQLSVSEEGIDLSKNEAIQELFDDLRSKQLYDIEVKTEQQSAYLQYCQTKGFSAKELYEDYLSGYKIIILGFSEDYSAANVGVTDKKVIDTAIEALRLYIESGKAVVFCHDTTTYSNNDEKNTTNYWGYRLNELVRVEAAMDRYGIYDESVESQEPAESEEATKSTAGTEGFSNIILDKYLVSGNQSLVYPSNVDEDTTLMVSQVNQGQITSYPYDVNLNMAQTRDLDDAHYEMSFESQWIAPTHAQYYQLDLDYDKDGDGKSDVIVWYSLASLMRYFDNRSDVLVWGELLTDLLQNLEGYDRNDAQALVNQLRNNQDTSAAYDAMPNDVRNNYYIYSVGNVTYTGMGHSDTMSKYEAKLFVNTLVAAYSLGIKEPTVSIVSDPEDRNSVLEKIYCTFDEDVEMYCEENETIYFYVQDSNLISGEKEYVVKFYYESIDTAGNTQRIELVPNKIVVPDNETVNYYQIEITADQINNVLKSQNEMKIYIEVQTKLMYDSGREAQTGWSYDTVTIRKRGLFNLD